MLCYFLCDGVKLRWYDYVYLMINEVIDGCVKEMLMFYLKGN